MVGLKQKLETGDWIPDTGYWIPNTGYWRLLTAYLLLAPCYPVTLLFLLQHHQY
jgi:hypothetical protein